MRPEASSLWTIFNVDTACQNVAQSSKNDLELAARLKIKLHQLMKSMRRSIAFLCVGSLLISLGRPVFAATDTWSGGGSDTNWGTSLNWAGGIAPTGGSNLVFNGTTQQANNNNIAGLTPGWVAFNNGGFTLNGNAINLTNTSAAFTNAAGLNIVNLGVGITSANSQNWYLAAGSELRITGALTNNSSANPLGFIVGGGTLRVTSTNFSSTRMLTTFNGTLILDGANAVIANDGFRFSPTNASQTAACIITNNGFIQIGGNSSMRIGQLQSSLAAGTAAITVSSGTLLLQPVGDNGSPSYGGCITLGENPNVAATFTQNGGLVWLNPLVSVATDLNCGNLIYGGNSTGNGTYNLNGGVLLLRSITNAHPGGTAVFNFNGGTLKPVASSTIFMPNVVTANVQSGGAIIDTTNFSVTIAQNLTPGSPSGGLVKLGAGTLTLTGDNTYTGATVVSNGTLVTSSSSFLGGGAITVASNANLSVTYSGSPIAASTMNLGSSATNSLTITLGASPSPGGNPVFSVTSLSGAGVAVINIVGSGFTPGVYPLVAYTSITGASSFILGTVPLGLSSGLILTNNTLCLNVALVPKNLEWSGTAGPAWNTTSLNWYDLNNGDNLTNYAQSSGSGDAVTFDDNGSASPSVTVGLTVTPSQIEFNNSSVSYSFSGTGKISGGVSLVKSSSSYGSLTISTTNDYTGGTLLQAGNLYVGCNQALGQGTITIDGSSEELASGSTANYALNNEVVLTTNATTATFGDSVNTGVLTLNGSFDFGSYVARVLTLNSEVVLGGPILCSGGGGIGTLNGSGVLVVQGQGQIGVAGNPILQNTANVIINGGVLNDGDAWRMSALNGTSLLLAVTNGGLLTITNAPAANLKVGYTGGDVTANNTLDIAGTVQLFGTGGNGSLLLGQSCANATVNLRSGGTLICNAVGPNGTAVTTANFYGGTLIPINSLTTFMQGLTNAYIWTGLTVNTTNLNITIAQPLLAGGAGGLTKIGTGILTLSGTNTYTGPTIVNAGKLVLTPAFAAPGGITVNTNATLAFLQSAGSPTIPVSSVTAGTGTNSALEVDLATNAPAAVITNLLLNGQVLVNVSGPSTSGDYPLFGYGTISGAGSLAVGQLPQGTVGHLITNAVSHTIDLIVSSITPTIWTGATNGNWDTTTTNWTLGGVASAYLQFANVSFNDAASNATVNLTTNLTPSSVTMSNSALAYQFLGSGGLSGSMSLSKTGTNSLLLGTANTFTGIISVNAGTIVASNAASLSAGPVYVTNSGTLDLDGNGFGLLPVVLSGSGVNGQGALVNSGGVQNNALQNVTLIGDTTIGGSGLIGLRTTADSNPGLVANGHKLTKTGSSEFNLNGGTTVAGLTNVWGTDIGNMDIQQGIFSFERRCALGLTNNTITVEAGATLQLYSLNQSLPDPVNQIVMTNAILQGTGASAGDVNTLAGPIVLNGSSNSIAETASTVFDLDGPITGTGGANFSGAITLAGTNTYTGPTVVSSGTLTVAYGGELTGTPDLTVVTNAILDVSANAPWTLGAGQTLAGGGSIYGSVVANGTVAPGTNIATLSFLNDLTLAGTNIMVLNKSNPVQTNDVLSVGGTLTCGGALTVVLSGSTPLAANDSFQLFSVGTSLAGAFASTNLPSGYTWDASQLGVSGTIRVTGVSSRPHPAFTSATASGGSIILSGTNAVGKYVLYGSTNVAAPLANWTPLLTNTFSGAFSFTNTTSAPQMFYLLQ
jgi:autotransporter-associated beta strand protein